MNREEKNQMIATLEEMLNDNTNFYLADISGLTAEENSALRRLCYKREVSLKVVKNTLLKKAFEKNGIIHASVAKVSFDAVKISENAQELIQTIIKLKPTAAKGTYVKSVYMSSTKGVGVEIDANSIV